MFDVRAVPLPNYTRREDIVNSVSHFIGVPFCIIALALMLKLQLEHKVSSLDVFGTCIYLVSTLCVFLVSGVYHGLKPGFGKQIARLIDHSDIYFMISGTITAMVLANRANVSRKLIIGILVTMWGLSLLGILLTFMDLKKFNIPQIGMYVVLGWSGMIGMKSLWTAGEAGKTFVITVLIGGILITLGTVLYLVGKKFRYFHAVFHLFVLLGTITNFIGAYTYHSTVLTSLI